MSERENSITVIVGRKGSGKSTRARQLIEPHTRRIIVDPMWEHTQGVIVRSFAELVAYVRPLRHGRYSAVLRTRYPDDVLRTIELACAGEPEQPPLPGALLVLDELDKLCSPSSLPVGVHDLVNYGRHYRVSLIGIARRPHKLHRDITANADCIIVGQTLEPRDVDYLTEFIGETLAARAKRLRRWGEFVTWPDDLESTSTGDDDDGRDDAARSDGDDAATEARATGAGDMPRPPVQAHRGSGTTHVPVALGPPDGRTATGRLPGDA